MSMMNNKYKYCFWFSKKGFLIFISHLDLMRLFERAFSRSGLPVLYTCGFNPHFRFSLPFSLSLGCTGEREFAELFLTEMIEPEKLAEKINIFLPKGIYIEQVLRPENCPDLSQEDKIAFFYKIELKQALDKKLLLERLADKDYVIERVNKKGNVVTDRINDFIKQAEIKNNNIEVVLRLLNGRTLKTEQLFKFFNVTNDLLSDVSRRVVID